ncbi:alkaline ceramidase 1 isoform X2 [Aquila chrysaetos chrysaetos]|uniref:alkaline ceramidase 1 isoform X2 n=1 Tax=Aquila chrysaetos chrysaetos TaxID=223781 RepID=UPI001176A9F3|nr:alkaline ceramidase 1 isoform X2 [Aquila chrysaetos chrysaetos]
MPSIFSYQSAEVDWCEGNFERSTVIAEYYNTISNVSFFVLSPALLYLNRQYRQHRALPMYVVSGLLFCVGIFSMYFHMTLSYVGQLLDELSILWTLAVAYSFWYPRVYFPRCIKTRKHFFWLSGVTTVISTLMSFIKPAFNAYVLNCIAFHLLYLTWCELKKHVLIAMSLLYCCPLVIYFDVSYEMPSFKPKLEYWPSDSWPVVVPYVTLEEPHKQC